MKVLIRYKYWGLRVKNSRVIYLYNNFITPNLKHVSLNCWSPFINYKYWQRIVHNSVMLQLINEPRFYLNFVYNVNNPATVCFRGAPVAGAQIIKLSELWRHAAYFRAFPRWSPHTYQTRLLSPPYDHSRRYLRDESESISTNQH